jgi:hypothetical protein
MYTLWFEYEMFPIDSILNAWWVVGEVVETLADGAWPEEVGPWGCAFEGYTGPQSLCPAPFFSASCPQ